VKKLKAENERLGKALENQKSKIIQSTADEQKSDKKKEL
jgi:hypothetical protein